MLITAKMRQSDLKDILINSEPPAVSKSINHFSPVSQNEFTNIGIRGLEFEGNHAQYILIFVNILEAVEKVVDT
jgi:hypothetical protein